MNIMIRAYQTSDLPDMIRIWNEVVEDGAAFPQEDFLNEQTGSAFFAEQTCTAVAADSDTSKVYGLYILHPNNIGRCGHICNASYAVSRDSRGLHIGEKLVSDCLKQGAVHGFRAIMRISVHIIIRYNHTGLLNPGMRIDIIKPPFKNFLSCTEALLIILILILFRYIPLLLAATD